MTLSPDQIILFELRGFRLNATIFYTWVVMALLTLASIWITRNLRADVPSLPHRRQGTEKMSIDWITVAAQIANFLVLVGLLKRFLYRPILDGIDAREAQISDRMQEALTAKAEADSAGAQYLEKLRDVEARLVEAENSLRRQAEQKRDSLLASARAQLQREQADWQAQLDREGRKYTAALQMEGGAALLAMTRKALDDLAGETLEARMAQRLVAQIAPMLPELKEAAGEAKAAVVLSHDPLPADIENLILALLEPVFEGISVTFETDPDQSPGLVLRIGGAQVGWTVDTYIEGLEQAMTAQLGKGIAR
jgi:F-type H+-transporting ATPase subunit b